MKPLPSAKPAKRLWFIMFFGVYKEEWPGIWGCDAGIPPICFRNQWNSIGFRWTPRGGIQAATPSMPFPLEIGLLKDLKGFRAREFDCWFTVLSYNHFLELAFVFLVKALGLWGLSGLPKCDKIRLRRGSQRDLLTRPDLFYFPVSFLAMKLWPIPGEGPDGNLCIKLACP